VLYLARVDSHFEKAKELFNALVAVPLGSDASAELLRYFQIQKAWDLGHYRSLTEADLIFRDQAKAHFTGQRFEQLYRGWQVGRVFAFAKRSMKATTPLQRHKAPTETSPSGRRRGTSEDSLVFPSRNGTYLRPGNLQKRWLLPACAKAELRRFSWQDFRRTHATLLSDMGEPLKTAQAQLGHASLSTTAEIYAQAVPASQRAAVERLEKAVGFLVDPNGPKIERVIHPGSSLIQ